MSWLQRLPLRRRAMRGWLCRRLLELLCKLGLLSRVLGGGAFGLCIEKPRYSLAGFWNKPGQCIVVITVLAWTAWGSRENGVFPAQSNNTSA
jgi:hypothetical protein